MNENINKMELKKQIAQVQFMLEDLQLYLNTHPMDKNALAKRNSYVKQLKTLRSEYDKLFDMINQNDSLSAYPWEWIEEPWPWEYEANYKL
ncbi:spore coat protein JB [Clostridium sp. USBA 49]|jgi:spore coat protein JB|uniref:spore coat protein CotJB n=1 Tax=Clostridium TaxID=1485 RepID=UPI00099A6833|nr:MULTISPECIES: spore coat protein CotJB [Clostridium]SKA80930.1 spore coat protein JB [Clostridium sp. USBA 49]